jgi:hypothetical protein
MHLTGLQGLESVKVIEFFRDNDAVFCNGKCVLYALSRPGFWLPLRHALEVISHQSNFF